MKRYMLLKITKKENECFRDILCKDSKVHIDKYGLVIDWFGALLERDSNILNRILTICKNEWFYGDMQRNVAAGLINTEPKDNFFVVRLSIPKKETCFENPPIHLRPFSMTYKVNKQELVHTRICFDNDSRTYKIVVKKKEREKYFENYEELPDLICQVQSYLKVNTNPNNVKSKYQSYFSSNSEQKEFIPYLGDDSDILEDNRSLNESSV